VDETAVNTTPVGAGGATNASLVSSGAVVTSPTVAPATGPEAAPHQLFVASMVDVPFAVTALIELRILELLIAHVVDAPASMNASWIRLPGIR
jgi:hypothetical protein